MTSQREDLKKTVYRPWLSVMYRWMCSVWSKCSLCYAPEKEILQINTSSALHRKALLSRHPRISEHSLKLLLLRWLHSQQETGGNKTLLERNAATSPSPQHPRQHDKCQQCQGHALYSNAINRKQVVQMMMRYGLLLRLQGSNIRAFAWYGTHLLW